MAIRCREVQEPIIARGDVTPDVVARCKELGLTLAAGLEAGVYLAVAVRYVAPLIRAGAIAGNAARAPCSIRVTHT